MVVGMELLSKGIISDVEKGIVERVYALRNEGITPGLLIATDNYGYGPTQQYMDLKDSVGARLGFRVDQYSVHDVNSLQEVILKANENDDIHGIIVQLPLKDGDPELTEEVVASIAPRKDVDGLGNDAEFLPATPSAILDLLIGYGIDYHLNRIAILGKGRLVGAPLFRHLSSSGVLQVDAYDVNTPPLDRVAAVNEADIIISAMGQPSALTPELFEDMGRERVLVDAATAEQKGVVSGDMSDELRESALANGWRITPKKGGVGPLTVRALLTNVVSAAEELQRNFVKS